jgi:hypothetical protein
MAIVKLDGQDINIEDAIAANDEDLKRVIVPFYPQLANAQISRETNADGLLIVRMVKVAGPKGSQVVESLKNAPYQINPAIDLAWKARIAFFNNSPVELKDVLDLQPQIEAAVKAGNEERKSTNHALAFLVKCPPVASNVTIAGF